MNWIGKLMKAIEEGIAPPRVPTRRDNPNRYQWSGKPAAVGNYIVINSGLNRRQRRNSPVDEEGKAYKIMSPYVRPQEKATQGRGRRRRFHNRMMRNL